MLSSIQSTLQIRQRKFITEIHCRLYWREHDLTFPKFGKLRYVSYVFKSAIMFEVYKSLNRIPGNLGKNHRIHIRMQFRSIFCSKLTEYFYICLKLENWQKNKVNRIKKNHSESLTYLFPWIKSPKPKYHKMVSNQDKLSKIILFRVFRWSITGFGQIFRFCSRKTV